LDDLTQQIMNLKADLPKPRKLTESEKDHLIQKLGRDTVKKLVAAKKELPKKRIPFIFNSLDTQSVVDVLYNNWEEALKRTKL